MLKKGIILSIIFFGIVPYCHSQSDEYIEGWPVTKTHHQEYKGLSSEPSLSSYGNARTYYDTFLEELMVSKEGGIYYPILTTGDFDGSHGDLSDMPSATNIDHDGRYYTETETGNLFLMLDASNDPVTGELHISNNVLVDEDLSVGGSLTVGGLLWAAPLGYIKGLTISYVSATSVSYGATTVHCKDKVFITATGETDTISNFSNGGFTYGYIDYSESTPTDIVYRDSTAVPVWNDAYQGYYDSDDNGDDRMISVFYCSAADEIDFFVATLEGGSSVIRQQSDNQNGKEMVTAQNPTGTWVTPEVADSDELTPVSAIRLLFNLSATDANARCTIYATSKELGDYQSIEARSAAFMQRSYNALNIVGEIDLGPERKCYWAADDDDENGSVHMASRGFVYVR